MALPASTSRLSARCLVAALALVSSGLQGATLYWDGASSQTANSDGGTGSWDTVLTNWDNGSNGADIAWNNATPDAAIFGGTAGTVTLGTGITAASLTFNATGYTVTGNTLTISSGGSISVGSGLTATVNSAISSAGSLNKTGSGTLLLNGGTSSISGALSLGGVGVPGGTFRVSSGSFTSSSGQTLMGTATMTVDGGTLTIAGLRTGEGTSASSTINLSAGTLNISGNLNAQADGRFNSFVLSHWGSTTTVNISGGTLNSLAARLYQTWDGTSAINHSGGTVNLLGVDASARTSTGTYTLSGGARLNLGAFGYLASTNKTLTAGTSTIGALADSTSTTAVTLAASSTTTFNTLDASDGVTARTQTWSGTFSGTGALAKAGAGNLTLTGTNTFAGGTTLTAGTIRVGNNAALGTGALNLNGGRLSGNDTTARSLSNAIVMGGDASLGDAINTGALTLAGTFGLGGGARVLTVDSPVTISGAISNGTLTKAGAGTLTLSNANAGYTGTLAASAGSLDINATLRAAAGITASGTATVTLNVTNLLVAGHGSAVGAGYLLTASGGGVIRFANSDMRIGNVALTNGGTLTSNRPVGGWGILFANTGAGQAGVTVSGSAASSALMNGTGGLNVQGEQKFVVGDITGNASADLTVSMVLADSGTSGGAAGGVVKSGAGTMAFTTAATYTGATRVDAGTLLLGTASYARSLQTSGIFVTGATSALEVNATNILYSGSSYIPITVDAGAVRIVTAAGSSHNHFGTLTLVNGATIRGQTALAPFVSQYSTFDETVSVLSGGSVRSVISGANASWGFAFNQVGGSVIDVGTTADAGADLEISGTVLSDGSSTDIVKRGAGRLLFSANNSRTTGTLIGAGSVIASHSSALGTGGTVTLNESATGASSTSLLLDATASAVTLSRPVTVANLGSGAVTLGSASTGANLRLSVFSGLVTLNRSATFASSASDDRLEFSGGIAGSGNVAIAGTGRVLFKTVAPTYTGSTAIASGATLQLGDGATGTDLLPDVSAVSLVAGGSLVLAKGGNSEVIGTLSGAGGEVRTLAANGTLSLGGDNGTGSFGGVLRNGADSTVLSVTKSGLGNQTLTGTNIYTGATTVSNGTLTLGSGGSLAASSAVSVSGGGVLSILAGGAVNGSTLVTGTLTGAGNAAAVTLASGGTLAVGASGAGTLTVGSLTLGQASADTSTLSFGISGLSGSGIIASYLQVDGAIAVNSGTGKVTLAFGSALANLAGGTVESPLAYDIITYGGSQLTASELAAFAYTGTTGARQGVTIGAGANTVRLLVSAAYPIWKGAVTDWSGATAWRLNSNSADTAFLTNDTVVFDDSASSGTVNLTADVAPISVTVSSSSLDYTFGTAGGFAITAGSLVKSGGSKLTIGNANSFAGGTTLTAGTLELADAAALGTGAVNLEGGVLDLNGYASGNAIVLKGGSLVSDGGTLSGAITESGGARELAVGSSLTLSGDSSFTGGVTVAAGTLTVSGAGRLGAGATSGVGSYAGAIANAGTLAFATSANQTLSGAISGAGALSQSGPGTLTLTGDNSFTGGVTVAAGTLAVSGAGRLGAGATPGVGAYAGAIANDGTLAFASSANQTLSGAISGAGALSQSGPGTLSLTGDNAFTGGITVAAGALEIGGTGRLGQGAYAGAIANAGTLRFVGTSNQSLSGALSGAGSLAKSGSGILTVTGSNSGFTGSVTLTEGVVAVGSDAPFGNAGTLNLNGGTLRADGSTGRSLSNPVVVGAAVTLGDAAANGPLTLAGTVNLGGVSRTLTAASAVTLSGVVSNGTLVKGGAGTMTLSGATTFSGGLTVSAGTLAVTGTNSAGTLSVNVQSGAVLDLRGGGLYRSGVFSGTGTHMVVSGGTLVADKFDYGAANSLGTLRNNYFAVELNNGGKIRLSADQTFFRAFQVGTGGGVLEVDAGVTATKSAGTTGGQNIFLFTQNSTLTFGGAGNLVMPDALGTSGYGNAGFSLAKSGAGILTLTGASVFTGGFTLSQGVLRVGNNGALGSGTLTINGGEISSDGASARSLANAVVLGGDATLGDVANLGALTFSSTLGLGGQARTVTVDSAVAISGAVSNGSLTKAGLATLTLNGAADYAGNTAVSAGTLAIGSGAGIYRGAYRPAVLSVASGATLELQNWHYNETTASLGGLAAGAASVVLDGGVIRVVGATPTSYGRGVTVNSGGATLEAAAGANWTVDVVNDSTGWVYNGNPSVVLSGAGVGAFQKVLGLGAGGLTKSGSGTWTVSGANTYAGATAVSNGTLRLGNAAGLGTVGGGTVVASGATLDLNGQSVGAEAIGIAGLGSSNAGALVNNAGTSASLSGSVTLSADATVGGSGDLVVSGQVTGGFRLTKVGAGSLTLSSAANDHSGGSTIAAGRLVGTTASLPGSIVNNAALTFDQSVAGAFAGTISGTGSLTKSGSGAVALTGANSYAGDTAIGAGTLEIGGAGQLGSGSYAGGVANSGVLRFNTTADQTLSGALTGSGSITKDGSGILTITGAANTFSGGVTVNSGRLVVGAAGALGGAGGGAVAVLGGILDLGGFSIANVVTVSGTGSLTNAAAYAGTVSVTTGTLKLDGSGALGAQGNASIAAGAVLDLFGSAVGGASVSLNGAGAGAGALVNTSGSTATFGGTLALGSAAAIGAGNITLGGAITGAHGLSKSGAGTLVLNTASNAASSLTVSGGTVVAGNAGALGQGGVSVTGGAILDLNSQSVGNAIALSGGNVTNASAFAGTLTTSGSNALNGTFGGTFVAGGTVTTSSGLTFTDTLKGSGSIAGNVTVDGGTHAPGTSPGVQTIDGNLTYSGTAPVVEWELIANTNSAGQAGTAFDKIVVNGNLNFSVSTALTLVFDLAGTDVDWTLPFWNSARSWILFDVSGSTTGFSSLSLTDAIAHPLDATMAVNNVQDKNNVSLATARTNDAGFYLGLDQNGADIRLYYRPVPEPSTYGLMLGALALAGAAIRRRRQSRRA